MNREGRKHVLVEGDIRKGGGEQDGSSGVSKKTPGVEKEDNLFGVDPLKGTLDGGRFGPSGQREELGEGSWGP
jgi:hypothetical protein